MGCGDVRLLRTIGGVDFRGQERATRDQLRSFARRSSLLINESRSTGQRLVPDDMVHSAGAVVLPRACKERGKKHSSVESVRRLSSGAVTNHESPVNRER